MTVGEAKETVFVRFVQDKYMFHKKNYFVSILLPIKDNLTIKH